MENEETIVNQVTVVIAAAIILLYFSGCMQVLGAERVNAWGLEIESTTGFEVSAGVQQFNGGDNRKTMKKVGNGGNRNAE